MELSDKCQVCLCEGVQESGRRNPVAGPSKRNSSRWILYLAKRQEGEEATYRVLGLGSSSNSC